MADLSFVKEEYQALRREADTITAELNTLEKHTLFAVAAALAWFASQPLKGPFVLAWFAPFFLVVFAVLRTISIRRHQGRLSQYLARLEEAARQEPILCMGWEHFQNSLDPARPAALLAGGIGRATLLLWFSLATGAFAFGLLGFLAQINPSVYRWIEQAITKSP